MTTMKKSLLALSIASLPMAAAADLQPMNNKDMGNVTGQQGVTIELSTSATIDQVEYSQGENTGSVLVDGIRIGGHDDGETVDVSVNVDLATGEQGNPLGDSSVNGLPAGDLDEGDAYIEVRPLGNGVKPVEAGVDADRLGIASSDGSEQATMISDFEADFWVTRLDITARVNNQIQNGTAGTGSIRIRNIFHAEISADFDVAAISLPTLRMAGADQLDALKGSLSETDRTNLAINGVTVNAEVGSGPAISSGSGVPDETLRVDLNEMTASMWMPKVQVGGGDSNGVSSIGSVGIKNLNVADTQMAIYGRE
ncbi:DUF6160 family protein [Salicola sp. Rm-C-2C1-2]|uniref:DUF6160 family protein n=1 Tax=Salicola sp. Rm-C-2C1-2 TaxID=3141321 RepID=UPI0032E3DA3A